MSSLATSILPSSLSDSIAMLGIADTTTFTHLTQPQGESTVTNHLQIAEIRKNDIVFKFGCVVGHLAHQLANAAENVYYVGVDRFSRRPGFTDM